MLFKLNSIIYIHIKCNINRIVLKDFFNTNFVKTNASFKGNSAFIIFFLHCEFYSLKLRCFKNIIKE